MPRQKKANKDPVIQAGQAKIPTSTVLAVITAIFTGIGSLAAGNLHDNKLEVKVAKIENDVEWIKQRLSGGGSRGPDSLTEPLRSESQVRHTSPDAGSEDQSNAYGYR